MEFVLPADSWAAFQKDIADSFQPFREPGLGRELIINQNVFIEKVLPLGVVRPLAEKEMEHYRRPFLEPESREPVWRFPNEIPIAGEPADVWEKAKKYMAWLPQADFSQALFFWATPATHHHEGEGREIHARVPKYKERVPRSWSSLSSGGPPACNRSRRLLSGYQFLLKNSESYKP